MPVIYDRSLEPLAGFDRRVDVIVEAIWGMRVSPWTGSDLNQKIYGRLEEWRYKPSKECIRNSILDGYSRRPLPQTLGHRSPGLVDAGAIGVNQNDYSALNGKEGLD